MQKALLLWFLFATLFAKAQNIDVLHYSYELELNDKNDSIYGKATILFKRKNPGAVYFDLTNVGRNGKGIKVYEAGTSEELTGIKFLQEGNKLIFPGGFATKRDSILLFIHYKGIPGDGLIISKNKYGDRTFFADNWPNRAHHWIPCIDKPDDKASFEFIVTAPSHYQVISNGIKIEEKDLGNGKKLTHWKEDIPLPTKVMVIGVARFAVKTFDDSPKNIPVSAWVYPQDSTKGFYDYALATEILKFYSAYIAPYPYKKLANVQSKTIFGGMENASAIFYAENSVTGDRSSEDLLAHEIAHQWFGDMASETSFEHLWLSEGFATYFTDLYFEKKYGRDAMITRLKKERNDVIAFAKSSNRPVVDSTKDLMSLLNANSYQKGSWVLHMLRNQVGNDTFQKIIQTYYNQFKGSNAESRDFTKVATEVTQTDMRPFFHQWLYRSGIPQIKMTWKWLKNKLVISVQQMQKLPYEFPLEIKIIENGGTEKIVELNVHKKTEIISLPYRTKPSKIILDPNTNLLFSEPGF